MRFQYTNIISSDRDTGAHFSSLFFLCVFYFNLSAGGGSGRQSEELSDHRTARWAPSFSALQPQENKNKSPPGRGSVILMVNPKSGLTVLPGGFQPLHPAFPTPLTPV